MVVGAHVLLLGETGGREWGPLSLGPDRGRRGCPPRDETHYSHVVAGRTSSEKKVQTFVLTSLTPNVYFPHLFTHYGSREDGTIPLLSQSNLGHESMTVHPGVTSGSDPDLNPTSLFV